MDEAKSVQPLQQLIFRKITTTILYFLYFGLGMCHEIVFIYFISFSNFFRFQSCHFVQAKLICFLLLLSYNQTGQIFWKYFFDFRFSWIVSDTQFGYRITKQIPSIFINQIVCQSLWATIAVYYLYGISI